MQLELFAATEYREPAHFVEHYRRQLKGWPAEVMYYRHARSTTGWSMCANRFFFARRCFSRGAISRCEFRRWWRFNRRVQRWALRN